MNPRQVYQMEQVVQRATAYEVECLIPLNGRMSVDARWRAEKKETHDRKVYMWHSRYHRDMEKHVATCVSCRVFEIDNSAMRRREARTPNERKVETAENSLFCFFRIIAVSCHKIMVTQQLPPNHAGRMFIMREARAIYIAMRHFQANISQPGRTLNSLINAANIAVEDVATAMEVTGRHYEIAYFFF